MSENKIIVANFVFLGKTFGSAGKSYTASTTTVLGTDEDGDGRVKSVTLTLEALGLGKKTLYFNEFKSDDYAAPLDAGVIGALKSPYENRAAVVIMEVERGWEGPPHNGNIRIAGADLAKGFEK